MPFPVPENPVLKLRPFPVPVSPLLSPIRSRSSQSPLLSPLRSRSSQSHFQSAPLASAFPEQNPPPPPPQSIHASRAPPGQRSPSKKIFGGGYPPWPMESLNPLWPPELPAPQLVPEWKTAWRPPALSPCPLRPPGYPPYPPQCYSYDAARAFREGEVVSRSPVELHCISQHTSGRSPALRHNHSHLTSIRESSSAVATNQALYKTAPYSKHSLSGLEVTSSSSVYSPTCWISVDVFLQLTLLKGEIRTTNSAV